MAEQYGEKAVAFVDKQKWMIGIYVVAVVTSTVLFILTFTTIVQLKDKIIKSDKNQDKAIRDLEATAAWASKQNDNTSFLAVEDAVDRSQNDSDEVVGQQAQKSTKCACSEHSVLQSQIDVLNDKLRRIHFPVDCTEIVLRRKSHRGGKFTIFPDSFGEKGIDVYCDAKTDGGGWLVFQRRMDGSVNFFRRWDDYANGFGDLTGEFWLGLKNIHKLMGNGNYKLRVDLKDFDGNTAYAEYSTFKLGGPGAFFNATITGYNGTAGNSLLLNNVPFSTKDQDHDHSSRVNCANLYKGGMWYVSCHTANLNGLYLKGRHDPYAVGVNWKTWKGYHYSLKFSEMKIRRIT